MTQDEGRFGRVKYSYIFMGTYGNTTYGSKTSD